MTDDLVINALLDRLPGLFRVQKVILFGSRAEGTADAESDYDFLIVAETDLRPAERGAAVRGLLMDIGAPMDFIVTTPEEYEKLVTWRSSVIHTAATRGKVLYEAA